MTFEPLINAPFAIQFHVATVLPAAVLGAILLARPKGTPAHRLLGKIWLVLMVMTSFSTFFIHGINMIGGFSPIHLLSVYVILGSVRAIQTARQHNIRAHRAHVAGMYFGGIVVAGLDGAGRAVVLADCSVTGASPAGWAGAVVRAFRRFDADRVVAEINQGGDMVTAMLKSVEADLPVTTVRATRGKFLRAEPVAALYEQGRVAHAGAFAELEDQMCDFGPDGLSAGRSPDRLDALVWALTALVLDRQGEPRVRGI